LRLGQPSAPSGESVGSSSQRSSQSGDDANDEADIIDAEDHPRESEEAGSVSDSSLGSAASEPLQNPLAEEDLEDRTYATDGIPDAVNAVTMSVPLVPEKTQRRSDKGKDATLRYVQPTHWDEATIRSRISSWANSLSILASARPKASESCEIDSDDAEEKLSLTVSKADFGQMKILGQFNLGFIIAVRYADEESANSAPIHNDDEIFIIDQHASDEKYNFERLQAVTIIDSQRLVHPKRLELTAMEEEIVKDNLEALRKNGFEVDIDESGDYAVGLRCQLLALPLSKETTFGLQDLEELISILGELQASGDTTVPRPSKVRKMFAMRACRSSVMIGKALTQKQMEKLVRHMGELDKPWNCPHGRPTMRHLASLRSWDDVGWHEDSGAHDDNARRGAWRNYAKT
jgi:DNA mismatch repair protein PMS2